MILAAGLGTRLQPLSDWCAKPAMPVRGIPVVAHTLALLAHHGVREVVVNLHHLPETVRSAIERHRPAELAVRYSPEEELLGTGGGIKRVADFLRQSDPSLVLAGDMLLDVDLTRAVALHRERGDATSLLACEDDSRAEAFGTLGFDDGGALRRIGSRFDLGGETRRGLFLGVRLVSARSLDGWPPEAAFEDLHDWIAPRLRAGASDVRVASIPTRRLVWEPVGTPEEYWRANFHPPVLSYGREIPGAREARIETRDGGERIVGAGARVEAGARLDRVVVWPNEVVPGSLRARDGVFARGRFIPCRPEASRPGRGRG